VADILREFLQEEDVTRSLPDRQPATPFGPTGGPVRGRHARVPGWGRGTANAAVEAGLGAGYAKAEGAPPNAVNPAMAAKSSFLRFMAVFLVNEQRGGQAAALDRRQCLHWNVLVGVLGRGPCAFHRPSEGARTAVHLR